MEIVKLFVILLLAYQCQSQILAIETFKNVQKEIESVQNSASLMSDNHPDAELEILKMFQNVLPRIEPLESKIFNTDENMESISAKYELDEYFTKPWNKLKFHKWKISNNYNDFQRFVYSKVFVDEVIVDNFVGRMNQNLYDLDEIHKLFTWRNESFLKKLHSELYISVSNLFENL